MEKETRDFEAVPTGLLRVAIDAGRIAEIMGHENSAEIANAIASSESKTDIERIGRVIGLVATRSDISTQADTSSLIHDFMEQDSEPEVNKILQTYIDEQKEFENERKNRIRTFLLSSENEETVLSLEDSVLDTIANSLELVVESQKHRFPSKAQNGCTLKAEITKKHLDGMKEVDIARSMNMTPYRIKTEIESFKRMFGRAFPNIHELVTLSQEVSDTIAKFERFDELFENFYKLLPGLNISNQQKEGILLRLPSLAQKRLQLFPKKMQPKLQRHIQGLIEFIETGTYKSTAHDYSTSVKSIRRGTMNFVKRLYKMYPNFALLTDVCHEAYVEHAHETDSILEMKLSGSSNTPRTGHMPANPVMVIGKDKTSAQRPIIELVKSGGLFDPQLRTNHPPLDAMANRLTNAQDLSPEESAILKGLCSSETQSILPPDDSQILTSALEKCTIILNRWGYQVEDPQLLVASRRNRN